jgi:uncharacterized protein YegP (UPF0339 family)
MASDFDMKKATNGEWYWVLNAANGQVICKSTDGYKNRQDCLHSIRIVKDLAPEAPVWDLSGSSATRVPESDVK